ncbi:MAG: GtrA family protein [Desulfobulbaceae bacterium]|nr:GtrA family protein [Desulfobulbaceae bacterium]
MIDSVRSRQAQRFAVTGLLSTGIHALIAAGLINSLAAIPPLANGVAFVAATFFSYLLNTRWSFSTTLHRRTLARFTLVASLGCLLAVGVSWLADGMGLHYLVGIAGVVCTVPPATFLLHSLWTYNGM